MPYVLSHHGRLMARGPLPLVFLVLCASVPRGASVRSVTLDGWRIRPEQLTVYTSGHITTQLQGDVLCLTRVLR